MSSPVRPSRRRAGLVAALAAATLASPFAAAQAPGSVKLFRIFVPFAAGGGQDIFIRIVAPKLQEQLKQTIVIDNRAGASGNIAAEPVAQSAPDGGTVLLGTAATHGMNQSLFKTLPFDAQASFEPVAKLADVPLALVVHPSVPGNDVRSPVA